MYLILLYNKLFFYLWYYIYIYWFLSQLSFNFYVANS